MVCSRGSWLIEQCSILDLYCNNGTSVASSTSTCIRFNGSSVVDYMCSRDPCLDFTICSYTLEGLSDHRVLSARMKFDLQFSSSSVPTPTERILYKWVGGGGDDDLSSDSIWTQHTDTAQFNSTVMGLLSDPALSVDSVLA